MIEMQPDWGHGMPPDARWHIAAHFAHLPIDVVLDTSLTAITDGEVHTEGGAGTVTYENVDTVVVAAGAVPNTSLLNELRELVPSVIVIGDARSPRSALEAVAEGSRAARQIGGRA